MSKVPLTLVGIDGNAFAILGAFKKAARRAQWSDEEIDAVVAEATSDDYDHLLSTIMEHCVNNGLGPDAKGE